MKKSKRKHINKPQVEIVEQPSSRTRIRFANDKRISYIRSSGEDFFPSIRITNYSGPVTVIISCVTKDPPYKPHPYQVFNGLDKTYEHGVSYIYKHRAKDRIRFKDLFVARVAVNDMVESLTQRERMQVDPFNTGFEHKFSCDSIDPNCVRLCFEVVLESPWYRSFVVDPVVSEPIYATTKCQTRVLKTPPTIHWLSRDSATVAGGSQICILCDEVLQNDIEVRFYHDESNWEALGEFVGPSVFKQVAIVIQTPEYRTDTLGPESVREPLEVSIQLMRPSDGKISDPVPFKLLPLKTVDHFISTSDGFSLIREDEYPKKSTVSVCHELQAEIVQNTGSLFDDATCELWELPPVTEPWNSILNIFAVNTQSSSFEHSSGGLCTNGLSVKPIEDHLPTDNTTYDFDADTVPSEFIIRVSNELQRYNFTDNDVGRMEEVMDSYKRDLNPQEIVSNSTDMNGVPCESQTNSTDMSGVPCESQTNSTDMSGVPYESQTNSADMSGVPYESQTNSVTIGLPSVEVDYMTDPNSNTNSSMLQQNNYVHCEVIQEQSFDLDHIFPTLQASNQPTEEVVLNIEDDNSNANAAEKPEEKRKLGRKWKNKIFGR